MSRASQVVVLVEDQPQQRFVRRYLYELGYAPHDIRFLPLPSGKGAGEQSVRQRYAPAVQAFRQRQAATALVVAIDADTGEVSQRNRQLRTELDQAGLGPRADGEAVAHLIPKRNIETWILCLTGREVDEETDYSRDAGVHELIPAAAAAFREWSRPNAIAPDSCVPSLRAAIPEVRRLGR